MQKKHIIFLSFLFATISCIQRPSSLHEISRVSVDEIIIATNPTVEGDTTALYLNKIILEAELPSPPKVTRLATGIPVGGDLEYIDKRTLSLSFRGRSQM